MQVPASALHLCHLQTSLDKRLHISLTNAIYFQGMSPTKEGELCIKLLLTMYQFCVTMIHKHLQLGVYVTCFILKKVITSFAPASPKTRSCSNCPRSRSPSSLISLLIFPAICRNTNVGLRGYAQYLLH